MVMKNVLFLRSKCCRLLFFLCAVTIMAMPVNASAFKANLGSTGKLDVDTTISYGMGWRLENPDPALQSTGNMNFNSGDLITNGAKVSIDADARLVYFGVFARGRALWDFIYAEKEKFHPATEKRHGKDAEVLDIFAYSNDLKLGVYPVELRAGRQSISWGESLLVGNSISTAQSPLDSTRANAPGVELKDLFLPTGSVLASISNEDSRLNLVGYYKWEWQKTRLDEKGSFFSTSDALDDAATQYQVGPFALPRLPDDEPSGGGEYGAALRYLTGKATEFGLYYIRYHETVPMIDVSFLPLGYKLRYQEGVDLFGASISGIIGSANVAAEISYRPNMMVTVAGMLPTYKKAEILQVQVSYIRMLGDIIIANNATLVAEWAYNVALDINDGELAAGVDKEATGGGVKLDMDYYNVMDGLNITIPLNVMYNPKGSSVAMLSNIVEDSHSASCGVELTYLNVYRGGIKYTNFFGNNNSKRDRDYVSVYVKYTF